MRVFGWSEAVDALEFSSLIEALRQAFRSADTIAPPPHRHTIAAPPDFSGTLQMAPHDGPATGSASRSRRRSTRRAVVPAAKAPTC